MRKSNRAPETRTDGDLFVTYSREERLQTAAFPGACSRKRRPGGLSRLILFDLLFLCIIGGIIVPFMIQRNLKSRIGPLSFEMELRRDDNDILVSLRMFSLSTDMDREEPVTFSLVLNGKEVAVFDELSPTEGDKRILRYRIEDVEETGDIICRINWQDDSVALNGKI